MAGLQIVALNRPKRPENLPVEAQKPATGLVAPKPIKPATQRDIPPPKGENIFQAFGVIKAKVHMDRVPLPPEEIESRRAAWEAARAAKKAAKKERRRLVREEAMRVALENGLPWPPVKEEPTEPDPTAKKKKREGARKWSKEFVPITEKLVFKLSIDGHLYHLYPVSGKLFEGLRRVAETGKEVWFRVWPSYNFTFKRIVFTVLSWSEKPEMALKENIFYLRGIWQFIPQHRSPVVTVYRNHLPKAEIKENDDLRHHHIPLIWKPCPVIPYRYRKEGEQMPRLFVEVAASFDPQKGEFKCLKQFGSAVQPPRFMLSKQKFEAKLKARQLKEGKQPRVK